MADYRPISLCNVVYKLVAKTLANRLKKILPLIISENQSAFIPGRLIVDNVLVAYEALHHMKNWRGGKEGLLALKLDISKAYDRVEWIFLEHIMRKLGFSNKWIKIVLSCVSTVSYSILINGEPKGRIIPSRGLRQGDPLSPYLFILCAKGLSSLIQAATNENFLHGVVVARGAPKISHLFFADDSLLFCKANIEEVTIIQYLLHLYEKTLGQRVNTDKTCFFFQQKYSFFYSRSASSTVGCPLISKY